MSHDSHLHPEINELITELLPKAADGGVVELVTFNEPLEINAQLQSGLQLPTTANSGDVPIKFDGGDDSQGHRRRPERLVILGLKPGSVECPENGIKIQLVLTTETGRSALPFEKTCGFLLKAG